MTEESSESSDDTEDVEFSRNPKDPAVEPMLIPLIPLILTVVAATKLLIRLDLIGGRSLSVLANCPLTSTSLEI